MHRLLRRQLKRALIDEKSVPKDLALLLDLIDQAYLQFDDDREILERSLELSSAELVQRNTLMRAVFRALPDVFLWINQDGVIKDCKGGIEHLFEIKPAQLFNMRADDIPGILDRDIYALARQMLGKEPFFQSEYSLEHGQQARHLEARFARLNVDITLALIRDISDRVMAEESLRDAQERMDHIIEFLPDATLVIDSGHRVIAWNRALEDMTGVPKEEILGKSGYEYAVPFYGYERPILLDFIGKDPGPNYPMYRPSPQAEDVLATEIHVPGLYNGKGAYVWAKATPLYDNQGEVVGAIQTIRDITDKKRTEITTNVLYLISTATTSLMQDRTLFDRIFEILAEQLDAKLLFISLGADNGSPMTYPFFRHHDQARHETLKHLAQLDHDIRHNPSPRILRREELPAPLAALQADTRWFASAMKFGDRALGSFIVQLPENPLRFSAADASVLAQVADHLALAISRSEIESALRVSEGQHRSIFENATEGIFQISLDHDLLNANPAMARILGYEHVPALMRQAGGFLKRILTSQDRVALLNQVLEHGRVENFELLALREDGTKLWLSCNMRTVRIPDGSISHLEGSLRNISMRKEAERNLAIQKSLFQQLFDNSPQGILLLGKDGIPLDLNASFTTLFGFTRDDLDGLLELLLPPDNLDASYSQVAAVLSGNSISAETQRRTRDGRSIPVSILGYPYMQDGTVDGAFFIFGDISERKDYENRLARQALQDNLTGLPNRILFKERLTRAMQRQKRKGFYRFAVLMIDLDGFKRVNDTLGHLAGDQLLREISKRLTDSIRSMDTVARMGGDEFAVLLEDFKTNQEVIHIIRRLMHDIRQPLFLQGREVQVSASVGVVLQTDKYASSDDLLRDADISMYRSKDLGKNQFKVFSKTMYEQVVKSVQLETDLRRALNAEEFELYFQPIYAAAGNRLMCFEALLRWNHPERGLLAPGVFIHVAEETGLIVEIGKWVLLQGCRTLATWMSRYPGSDIGLSLNLSPRDLVQPNLVSLLTDILHEEGLNAGQIRLEITETAVMDNPDLATSKLERLQKLGFQVAMDDFGTGYSSLSYLQRLPIDILKIDRSFVQTMLENPSNFAIIKAIIGLGKVLDLRIVAEGVETAEQMAALQELGCDLLQGYYLGRPLPEEQADLLLAELAATDGHEAQPT